MVNKEIKKEANLKIWKNLLERVYKDLNFHYVCCMCNFYYYDSDDNLITHMRKCFEIYKEGMKNEILESGLIPDLDSGSDSDTDSDSDSDSNFDSDSDFTDVSNEEYDEDKVVII